MNVKSIVANKGFTLIELLVVIAIIGLLAGMLFPAFAAARETAKKTKAKADVKQLDMVFKAVLLDYRTWPAGVYPNANGAEVGKNTVNFLRGVNDKTIRYMEFDKNSLDLSENFVDPWSTKTKSQIYQIALGDASVTPGGTTLPRQVAAWSYGKNGTSALVKDWIKSWE